MVDQRYNLVTFTPDDDGDVRVYLKLNGYFVLTSGVRPNITQAKIPYTEYAKFNGNPLRRGRLSFWHTVAPESTAGGGALFRERIERRRRAAEADVSYAGMRIVEVQPSIVGNVLGQGTAGGIFNKDGAGPVGPAAPIVAEYLAFIADARERLIPPRAGGVGPARGKNGPGGPQRLERRRRPGRGPSAGLEVGTECGVRSDVRTRTAGTTAAHLPPISHPTASRAVAVQTVLTPSSVIPHRAIPSRI